MALLTTLNADRRGVWLGSVRLEESGEWSGGVPARSFFLPKRIWTTRNTQLACRSEPHPTDDLLRFDHITGVPHRYRALYVFSITLRGCLHSYRAPNVISITYHGGAPLSERAVISITGPSCSSAASAECDFDHISGVPRWCRAPYVISITL